jgi:heme exporter protein D
MMDLGKYATDVFMAYGITIVLIVGLIAWSMRKATATKAKLQTLEDRRDG